MEKKKYKIVYERPKCIGVFACVAALPKRWEVGEDAKADLIDGKNAEEDVVLEVELTEEELKEDMEAAQICPVNVIHIFDENEKKLI